MKPKICFLYSRLSGYTAACQAQLKARYGAELMVVHWPVVSNAPFREGIFAHIDHRISKDQVATTALLERVRTFAPDVIIMSGWMDKDYLKIARAMRKEGIPVIAGSDTQWTGQWRQRVGRWIAPWYLHTAIDALWVTGERQQQLARFLGFNGVRCHTGFYTCDWSAFARPAPRIMELANPAFLYVGRLIGRKGITTLLEAYQRYRKRSKQPWELWVAGTGALETSLQGIPGIKALGFVQPQELPALLQQVRAFVLPSRVEPWGVALQEAVAAGLPLIASDACGAAVHLLTDGFNGFTFETDNVQQLAYQLQKISAASPEEWAQWSENSFQLSRQYRPERWADQLVDMLAALKAARG